MTSTENTTTAAAEAFDLDSWLAGAERASKTVTLFADSKTLVALTQVRERLAALPKEATAERSLGETSLRAELQAEEATLLKRAQASARRFRVTGSIEEETDTLTKTIRKEKDAERTAAADEARKEAAADATALEIPAKDRAEIVRTRVAEAMDAVVSDEFTWRILGDRVAMETSAGVWEPVGYDGIQRMRRALGDPQIIMLQQAWLLMTNEAPEAVEVPFSPAL